jgi:hypothetical protein
MSILGQNEALVVASNYKENIKNRIHEKEAKIDYSIFLERVLCVPQDKRHRDAASEPREETSATLESELQIEQRNHEYCQ